MNTRILLLAATLPCLAMGRGLYRWSIPEGEIPGIGASWYDGGSRSNLLTEWYPQGPGLLCNPEEFVVATGWGDSYKSDRASCFLVSEPCMLTLTAHGILPEQIDGVAGVSVSLYIDGVEYPADVTHGRGTWTCIAIAPKTETDAAVTVAVSIFVLGLGNPVRGEVNEVRLNTDLEVTQ